MQHLSEALSRLGVGPAVTILLPCRATTPVVQAVLGFSPIQVPVNAHRLRADNH